MPGQKLTIAVGVNDRTLPLLAGLVGFKDVEPEFVTAPLEEIFARAFDERAFDITELSFSNYLYLTAMDQSPYVGLPIFPSRSFRHSAIYIRTDRGIQGPRDLIGRTVGVREYSMTAALVARGMLEDEFGVSARDIKWRYGRADKKDTQPIARMLPRDIELEPIDPEDTLSDLLLEGQLDALIAYKPPPALNDGYPVIRRLFENYPALEKDYAGRTGMFPIMHLMGMRRDLAREQPELVIAICRGFEAARQYSADRLRESQALYTMLPWGASASETAETLLGESFWSYGVKRNLRTINALCRYSCAQGIAPRLLTADDLFADQSLNWVP